MRFPPDLWQRAGFGLYIHWPFCQAKCPYCDFNSHVAASVDQTRWANAYCAEIDRIGRETEGRVLSTVFFGGGTPSLMDPDVVATVIDRIRATWPMTNDPEITLEANPTSVEADRFQAFRTAGINRVSLGVQALNDVDLKQLGRLHSAQEAKTAFDIAHSVFDRVSFDLIYARQDQSLEAWRHELSEALSMAVDHLSLYQLTIEDGTAFGDRFKRGRLKGLPSEDDAADMYFLTQEMCEEAGLSAYETSNHAVEGAESRHNLIYWRSGDYAGIGPGSHGRLTLNGGRYATESYEAPGKWLGEVENRQTGESSRSRLSDDEHIAEYLLMGLRLAEGVDPRIISLSDNYMYKIINLADGGFMEVQRERCIVTPKGRPLLNAVLREILA